MDISGCIPTIVNAMLPERSGNLALRFKLRVDVDYFGEWNGEKPELLKRGNISCFEFLVTRPSNYTTVYMREVPFARFEEKDYPWKYAAHHDSCWREPFEIWRQAYQMKEAFEEYGIDRKDVHSSISFEMFSGEPHYEELVGVIPISKEGEEAPRRISSVDRRNYKWELVTDRVPLHTMHTFTEAYRKEQDLKYDYRPVPLTQIAPSGESKCSDPEHPVKPHKCSYAS